MEKKQRLYSAMVWAEGSDKPGKRVTTHANSLREARERLEAEYGAGTVIDLHNPEDARRPR